MALIWEFDFPPFMVLIIAILNDGELLGLFVSSSVCDYIDADALLTNALT